MRVLLDGDFVMCYTLNMLKKIEKELKELNVGIVYIFGSTAQGIAEIGSDIDIGIVFTKTGVSHNYLPIYEKLYTLFSRVYQDKETDIVFLQDAPLSLQLNVIRYGETVYQISSQFKADYEERVMLMHSDFEPILKEFDRMVLERI